MLGCYEFCGYYDWTFAYVGRRWGPPAVARLWTEAIGGESQAHYAQAARAAGLAGLYRTWVKTGEEESCDWTFTLDEEKNILRWDMRQCPSKGFLLANDLHACADYCDHCMGWTVPLLAETGFEIAEHEHNHCGQCWGTMRRRDRPAPPLPVARDIRDDPRWNHGYIERWEHDRQLPLLREVCDSTDSGEVLRAWFGRDPAGQIRLVTDKEYADPQVCPESPHGVLIGAGSEHLAAVAARFHAAPSAERPLLMHAYLPGAPPVDFVSLGLPRPIPILPLLIRRQLYTHRPGGPHPDAREFLRLVRAALQGGGPPASREV